MSDRYCSGVIKMSYLIFVIHYGKIKKEFRNEGIFNDGIQNTIVSNFHAIYNCLIQTYSYFPEKRRNDLILLNKK